MDDQVKSSAERETDGERPHSGKSSGLGIPKDTAATIAYGSGFLPVLGWMTGLLMVFLEKDPYVRFHSFQAVGFFGLAAVAWVILEQTLLFSNVTGLLFLIQFIVWLLLLYRTFNGQPWVLPVIGKWAKQQIHEQVDLQPHGKMAATDPAGDQRMGA